MQITNELLAEPYYKTNDMRQGNLCCKWQRSIIEKKYKADQATFFEDCQFHYPLLQTHTFSHYFLSTIFFFGFYFQFHMVFEYWIYPFNFSYLIYVKFNAYLFFKTQRFNFNIFYFIKLNIFTYNFIYLYDIILKVTLTSLNFF